MIYSNACAYAIRALSWLTMKRPEGYMLLEEICEDTQLPRHFLAKIFQDLVRRQVLVSAKGRGGGFALARPADEITLREIVEVIDGPATLQRCVVGMTRCDDKQPCPEHDQWKPIRAQIREYLEKTTLKRMAHTLERKMELVGADAMVPVTEAAPARKKKKKSTARKKKTASTSKAPTGKGRR